MVAAADLTETDDAYLVHVEVPGMRKDQLNVEVSDRDLVITGEIPEQSGGKRHRSSRRTGNSSTAPSCLVTSRPTRSRPS